MARSLCGLAVVETHAAFAEFNVFCDPTLTEFAQTKRPGTMAQRPKSCDEVY